MATHRSATSAAGPVAARAPFLRRTLASLAGLGLSALALHSAAGFVIGDANPALGVVLSPGHAIPLGESVENALHADVKLVDRAVVRETALAAVVRSPLDHRSARSIALLDKASGFDRSASSILALVGRATLHDTIAHAFLLDAAYRRGDYGAVVREADIVMRTDDRVKTETHMMLNSIVADGRVIPDLARRLSANPRWRHEYLEIMGAYGKSPANEERLLRLLRASPTPPQAAELRPWFMRRAADTPANMLRAQYDALSPVRFGADETLIRNGGFEGSGVLEPYNWTLFVTDTSAGEIGPGPSGPGKVLYVELDRNALSAVATQMLTLTPGRYRVTARSYAVGELSGDAGLSLACSNGGQPRDFAFLPVRAPVEQWANLGWDLDVPAGCQGPLLTITRRAARLSKLEQFYLDDIKIAPRAAAAADRPAPQ